MKRLSLLMLLVVFVLAMAVMPVQAYTINDPQNDAIGVLTFESYGINVYNFTPGVNNGAIYFDLFTNYPQSGLLVGGWDTKPADFFMTETYHGVQYEWAIPLVTHGSFTAGTMYAVGSSLVSDNFEPAGGGYIYNHNVPVQVNTMGNNYGYDFITGGSVTWNDITPPGSPDWRIRVTTSIWQDDPNGSLSYLWGTATCANDVISSPVPEPATMFLLGSGLIGLAGFARKRFKK